LEQIEYLRAQLAFSGTHVPGAPLNVSNLPPIGTAVHPTMESRPYVSDEEIDAQVMLDNGEINKEQVAEVLEALGLAPEFDLDSIDFSVK
jgi:hypothetical protein